MPEQEVGVEVVYVGCDTFLRACSKGDETGTWYPTFTEARKAAIDLLRIPRDNYNKAIEHFKTATLSDMRATCGPYDYREKHNTGASVPQ